MGLRDGTVSFNYSFGKAIFKLSMAFAVVFIGASGCIALILFRDQLLLHPSSFAVRQAFSLLLVIAGCFCMAAFGGILLIFLVWRYSRHRGPIVIYSLSGFIDTRITAEEIPWEAITTVIPLIVHRRPYLMLVLLPEYEKRMKVNFTRRWSASLSKGLDIDGPTISDNDLNTDIETLSNLFETYMDPVKRAGMKRAGALQRPSGNETTRTGFGRRSTYQP